MRGSGEGCQVSSTEKEGSLPWEVARDSSMGGRMHIQDASESHNSATKTHKIPGERDKGGGTYPQALVERPMCKTRPGKPASVSAS